MDARVWANMKRPSPGLWPGWFAAGVVALALMVFKGNWLVLTPVLGLWTFVVSAFPAVVEPKPGKRCAGRRREEKRRSAGQTRKPALRWQGAVAAIVWGLALLLGVRRVLSGNLPREPEVARAMAEAEQLVQTGNLDDALVAFRKIDVPQSLPRRAAQKHHNIGVICMRLGRWEEAETAFQEAVRCDPADVDAHCNLARLALRRKDQAAALTHIDRVLSLQPGHPGATRLKEGLTGRVSLPH